MLARLIWITIGIIAIATSVIVREVRLMPDGRLHLYFLDVGQGDSCLIVTPSGRQVVIDGGPDGSALAGIGRHLSLFDRSIDLLVMSHPQLDHMASFPEILRRYRVGAVLMTGVWADLPQYSEFLELIRSTKTHVILADPSHDMDLGDGTVLDVVWPPPGLAGKALSNLNNTSVILRVLEHGHSVALFTGDIEADGETALLKTGVDLRADILKVGHHGSKTSTSTGFLLAVHPEIAAISVGADNSFGHPSPSVIDRLTHFGIQIRRTDLEGDVEISNIPAMKPTK
jgi:competence protein ComEC